MPPADEIVATSANVEDEEDYVPDSLADFVRKAEQGLEDDLKFLEDLSSSPQCRVVDTTGSDITEAGKSATQLGEIEAEMENITILDKPDSKAELESDSNISRNTDELASPSRNPAVSVSDAEINQVFQERISKAENERSGSDADDDVQEAATKSNDTSAEASGFESGAVKQQSSPKESIEKLAKEGVLLDFQVDDSNNRREEPRPAGELHKDAGVPDQQYSPAKWISGLWTRKGNRQKETAPTLGAESTGSVSKEKDQQDSEIERSSIEQLETFSGAGDQEEGRDQKEPSPFKVGENTKPSKGIVETPSSGKIFDGEVRLQPETPLSHQKNTALGDIPVMGDSSPSYKNNPAATADSANISQDVFASSPDGHAVSGASLANAMEDLNISDISVSSSPAKQARSNSAKRMSGSPEKIKQGLKKADGNGKLSENKVTPLSKSTADRNAKTNEATKSNAGASARTTDNRTNSTATKLSARASGLTKPADRSTDDDSNKASKPSTIPPTSRLMQPAATARAHGPRKTTRSEPPAAAASSTSRFMRPTASAIAHHSSTSDSLHSSKNRGTSAAPVPLTTRFMQPSANARAQHTATQRTAQASTKSSKTSVTPTSRFMQPTAAALAHHTPASPSNQSSSTKSSRARAQEPLSPSCRLMQPTAATRAHHPPASPSTKSSSTKSSRSRATATVSPNSRFMQPTASAKAHQPEKPPSNQPSVKRKLPPVVPTSRFMQPTASAKRAHGITDTPQQLPSPKKRTTGLTVPQVSSHLLKPTAAMMARKTSMQPQAQQETSNFNVGSKMREPSARPPRKNNFANKAIAKSESVSGERTKKGEKPKNTDISLAQSTDILAKTLRSSSSTTSVSSRNKLTIPESPKFSSVRKRPVPKSSEELEWEMIEKHKAQSVKATRNPTNLHTGSSAGLTKQPKRHLTQVEPFKLSSTASYRKTRTTRTNEAVDKEEAQSVKATSKSNNLHTGSSAGLAKQPKRRLTQVEPFKLSSTASSREKSTVKDVADEEERKKGCHEQPLPKLTKPRELKAGKPGTKRPVTKPVPFKLNFAVDLTPKHRSLSGSKKTSEQPKKFKARPVPKTTFSPSMPVHPLSSPPGGKRQMKTTTPFQFQTDLRHEAHQKQLGMKLKQEEEDERKSSAFRAKKYKASPPPKPVARSTKTPTKPAPFKLESVQRHELYQELLEAKVSGEEEEFKKHLIPKALPLPESTFVYKPLSPSPSHISKSASRESQMSDVSP